MTEKAELLDLAKLEELVGYTIPFTDHDYGAGTPTMWNTIYTTKGLSIRCIMVVTNPNRVGEILTALKQDPKYLGGGAGSGFKETVVEHLDEISPSDLREVNIIVNENGRLVGYNTDAIGAVRGLEEAYADRGITIEGSHIIVLGTGGAGKAITRLLAERKARLIGIINRTHQKAIELAYELNKKYSTDKGDPGIAYAPAEHLIRGAVLSSSNKPAAIINTTQKGSDGRLVDYNAFATTEESPGAAESLARDTLRILSNINPGVIFNDIAMTGRGDTISLRLARSEGLKHLVGPIPMVVYQAIPAYGLIEKAHPQAHGNLSISESEIERTFKKAMNYEGVWLKK